MQVGVFGLLFILFVGLKLTGYIAWSWIWVAAPLWMPITILIGVMLFGLLMAAIMGQLKRR